MENLAMFSLFTEFLLKLGIPWLLQVPQVADHPPSWVNTGVGTAACVVYTLPLYTKLLNMEAFK